MDAACTAAWTVAGVLIAVNAAVLALIVAGVLCCRPWDPSFRTFEWTFALPRPAYTVMANWLRLCERLGALKPPPFRVAEVMSYYIQSQVLFTINELGIPEALRSGGPQTAAQLTARLGLKADPEWLERVLRAAASFGLVSRTPAPRAPRPRGRATPGGGGAAAPRWPALLDGNTQRISGAPSGATGSGSDAASGSGSDAGGRGAANGNGKERDEELTVPPEAGLAGDIFGLNAQSAALCPDHPCSVSALVQHFVSMSEMAAHLTEGLRRGVCPHRLAHRPGSPDGPPGPDYWGFIEASPRHAKVFNAAMRDVDHIGGTPVLYAYRWGSFDAVVDVAGGHGHFLARLLRRHPHLWGVVADMPSVVEEGRKWWEQEHADLLPRASFTAANFFDASSLPAPPSGYAPTRGGTALVLRNILHDWDDAASLKILHALRQRVTGRQPPGAPDAGRWPRARLVILESTLSDKVLPCQARHRHASDITMLAAFGSAKERDERQFGALLGAAGWRLRRVLPTCGLFCILEADPV